MQTVILILEIIGSVAFSFSGAMLGIKKQFDIFGIIILGVVTTVGGGFIRDITIGVTPPIMFSNPIYCTTAVITSLLICLPFVRRFLHKKIIYGAMAVLMDSAGLAAFTVTGVAYAYQNNADNYFLVVFTGVISGIGGGILRDVFAGEQPHIFRKHIYACASIIGAVLCAWLMNVISYERAMIISALTVLIIRLISAYFKINLPRIKDE